MLCILSVLGLAYLLLRFVLPWTAPLIPALAGAALLEPPVRRLEERGLPRAAASGACLLLGLGLGSGLVWILLQRAWRELRELGGRLPELLSAVSEKLALWQQRLGQLTERLPHELESLMDKAVDGALAYMEGLPEMLSQRAVELASGFLASLPAVLLFAVTAVMGLYFISASYPRLGELAKKLLPPRSLEKLEQLKGSLRSSVGKYFRAQLIMMAIVFGALLAAFSFMRLDYALVPALLIALVDALPVFGAGTVLLPWAAWELLAGDGARGAALAVCYGSLTILRSCIQAKLLGDQLGLHPLTTLICIYAGWKALGVWGMVLFPIGAICLKQLGVSGIIHIWNTEEKNDGNNFQYSGRDGHEHSGSHEYPAG